MTILNRAAIMTNLAKGLGTFMPQYTNSFPGTAGAAGSGYFSNSIRVNSLGTTFPGTLVSMLANNAATNGLLTVFNSILAPSVIGRGGVLGLAYRIGGVTLGATGNDFTHDAAAFPVTRTIMGQSTAVNLIPFIFVTTALTGTAAIFTLSTSGSTPGYTNQSGNSVAGNVSFTFPSATTAAASGFTPMVNYGDSAVQDIASVDVTTAATTGAFDIYGFEPFFIGSSFTGYTSTTHNSAIGPMSLRDATPASATSGTAKVYWCCLVFTGDNLEAPSLDIKVSNQ